MDKQKILLWTTQILRIQKLEKGEISLVFVNNRRIRFYNKTHRKIDRPTDVLAFPMLEGIGGDLHPAFLGDVMISLEMASTEARLYERTMAQQLLILLIHGILHLLGYNHTGSEAEAKRMRRRERILFKRLTEAKNV